MTNQTIEFNVKEGSIQEFFRTESNEYGGRRDDFNPYYFMKDVIHIPKHKLSDGVNVVKFQLKDTSRGSGKTLLNTYSYMVEDYDSISYELVLRHFDVKVVYPI